MARFITREIECDVTIVDSHYLSTSNVGGAARVVSFTRTDFLHFLRPADEDAHQMHMAALQSEIAVEQQEQRTHDELERTLLESGQYAKAKEVVADAGATKVLLADGSQFHVEREFYCNNCKEFRDAVPNQSDLVCMECNSVIVTFKDRVITEKKRIKCAYVNCPFCNPT